MKNFNKFIMSFIVLTFLSGLRVNGDAKKFRGNEKLEMKETTGFSAYVKRLYNRLNLSQYSLDFNVFEKALTGYNVLYGKGKVKNDIISIIDFNKPSTNKRLWVIDLKKKAILFYTLVAHGRNSGENMAVNFSNNNNSHMSSLGFYVTGTTYQGKHGESLVLHGMDPGYNSNAQQRSIVMHGADYVCEDFIKSTGRLGRSHGCPAVSNELRQQIISKVKNGSVLFIHKSSCNYNSCYLNSEKACEVMNKCNLY